MVFKKLWEIFESFLSGEASGLMRDMERTMEKSIDKVEKKIEVVTVKAIKASTVFLLILIGLIFAFVGLSNYLSEAWNLSEGVGHLIVGGALVLLGWFAKLIR